MLKFHKKCDKINITKMVRKNDIYRLPQYKLHPLHGDRVGQYALDLGRTLGFRLIIIPLDKDGYEWKEKDLQRIYKATEMILAWEVSNHYE